MLAASRLALALTLALLLPAVAARAAAGGWIAARVQGTVVCLEEGEWQELERGVVIAGGDVLRTLHSGRVELRLGAERISLAGDTAVELLAGGGGTTTVRQYSGTVVVEVGPGEAPRIQVETPALAVVAGEGVVTVTVSGNTAIVSVGSGTVSVIDPARGEQAVLAAGQAARSSGAGLDVAAGETFSPPGALLTGGAAHGRAQKDADGNGRSNGNSGDRGNGGNAGEKGKEKDKGND